MRLRFWKREDDRAGFVDADPDVLEALGVTNTAAGELVSNERAFSIADVFTCISTIAETIGTLPLKVYREVDESVLPADNHRAYRMLHDAPNPITPAHRFWSTAGGHLLAWGNAYIEKLRDENGLVSELWLIDPATVTIEWNPGLRQKRFVVWVGGEKRVLDDDRVLHLFGYSRDGLIGLSPIQQTREALALAKARERFEGEVYAKKPFLTGTIEHPGRITDGGVKLREQWQAVYGGPASDSRHGVAVLLEGATYKQMSVPLEDLQFVEATNLSKRTIASIFKLPPAYIGGSIGDSLTYQTVESNQIQFARQAIAPVVTNIAKFLSFDMGIFPFSSWYAEFVLEGLLRGDSQARGSFYKSLAAVSAITVDEIRARENMPPMVGPPATVASAPAARSSEPVAMMGPDA